VCFIGSKIEKKKAAMHVSLFETLNLMIYIELNVDSIILA
jgi:hypothetical protein